MKNVKVWFASLISFMVADYFWFGFIVTNFVREKLAPIANLKSDGSLNLSYGYGLVAYILMATMMTVFVWPKIKNLSLVQAVAYSALAGILMFGIYDFSVLAFAKYYPISFAAEDVFCGFLTTSINGLGLKLLIKD